jgi:hypothetical protein
LRDPAVIAAHCHIWVERVSRADGDPQVLVDSEDQFVRAALAEATSDMDKWLDYLAVLVSPDPEEAASRRGLLAMEIQTVIDSYPEALLQYESLPESLLQRLQEAAHPVVPAATRPTRMHGPPLGELPPQLQPQQWRLFFGQLATAILVVVGFSRERKP